MKVGTDGALLGAWASSNSGDHVIDIGAGTGILSLMLAQRSPETNITAIEPDPGSFKDIVQNVQSSPFNDRIKTFQTTLADHFSESLYDRVICNPPFYENGFPSELTERNHARQAISLPLNELLSKAYDLTVANGEISLIYPAQHELSLFDQIRSNNWFLRRALLVRPTPNKPFHRYLLELNKQPEEVIWTELTIESERHQYTPDFKHFLRDFYLAF